MRTNEDTEHAKRKSKRGRRAHAAERKALPEAIARELIEGIIILDAKGKEMRRVPSRREIARRLGVAHSLIVRIAESNDCTRRHEAYRKSNPAPFEAYEKHASAAKLPARAAAEIALPQERESASSNADERGEDLPAQKRRAGRPTRADSPAVPWNEVDNALVLGELFTPPNGNPTTRYPSTRVLARRYGIAHSAIVRYSQAHHCEQRRETAQQRLVQKTEEKVLEARATAIAVSKDDVLRMIDKFLLKFEKALDEDRVRYDVPGDFNTVVRLREFVMGGPDSRQESAPTITLEMLQERHAQMLKAISEASPAERGIIDVRGHELPCPNMEDDDEQDCTEIGPDPGTGE